MKGVVVRRAGDKTVVVETTVTYAHPRYTKKTTRTQRYLAHDAANQAREGDPVTLRATRPQSARKRWVIVSYGAGEKQTSGGR